MTNWRKDNSIREDFRSVVAHVLSRYSPDYWRGIDEKSEYPTEFVDDLTKTGALSALIPAEYGGLGLDLGDASVLLEEISFRGGVATPVHAQLYTMSPLLKYGSPEQKDKYLPSIADGTVRLQSFAVTEPDAGSETTRIKTKAVRNGDHYVVSGQKVWTSRVNHSDLILLLARTTPRDQVTRKTDGLSLFLIDMREVEGLSVTPIGTMVNHDTNELHFDNMVIPADSLIGDEGAGFRYLLDGLNAERILVAAECVGDGRWFIEKSRNYANERVVFDRPIGMNQGIQFPIARAHIDIEAADLMRWKAADLFDAGLSCGPEANMAKLLAADASWQAANVAMQTHGGYGMAREYDIERKFREARLYQVAPVSTNLILSHIAERVLGLPRSF